MANAGANAVGLYIVKEVTWGSTPASALKAQRYSGESLGQETQTTTSNEIRPDRNIADIIRTQVQGSGSINGEQSYGALHDLLEGGLCTAWTAAVSATVSVTITGTNKFVRATGDWTALSGMAVGKWFRVVGAFVNAGNSGVFRVVSFNATDLVVDATLVNEGVAVSATFDNDGMLRNGSTFTSFSMEKTFTDLTNVFLALRGMVVNTGSFKWSTGGINTWDMSFLGKSMEDLTATIGTGGPTAAPTNDVLNAIDNVTSIREGGALSTLAVSDMGINFNNNVRGQFAIGSAFAIGVGLGEFMVEGSLTAYFSSMAMLTKYIDFTTSSLSWRVFDAAGNMEIHTLPSIKYTNAQVVAGGKNSDVMAELSFQARYSSADGCTYQIDRIAA